MLAALGLWPNDKVNPFKDIVLVLIVRSCDVLYWQGCVACLQVLINQVIQGFTGMLGLVCRRVKALFNQLFSKQINTEISQSLTHHR